MPSSMGRDYEALQAFTGLWLGLKKKGVRCVIRMSATIVRNLPGEGLFSCLNPALIASS